MIAGHPFKGGSQFYSTGYLEHPDMKRFQIADYSLFVPPRPSAWISAIAAASTPGQIPSFNDFFATYFAGRSFNVTEPKCTSMLENMKRCWENHSEDPVDSCQYYISGFERLACGAK